MESLQAAVIAAGLEYLLQLSKLHEALLRGLQKAEFDGQGLEEKGWAGILCHLQKLADPLNDFGACEP